MTRRAYPSDLDDDTYHFVLPYLLLTPEHAAQRKHPLRDVLNALFWMTRTGAQWDYLPHDFPPPEVVRQQAARWFEAACFENMLHDLRILSRVQQARGAEPTAVIIDSRTLQSTPESGARAGYDGAKKRKGTKVHIVVDTLGHLLALMTTPANEQDRAQVHELCVQVQEVTGVKVEVAFVDQGYTGQQTALDAANGGVELLVVKRPEASKGFILVPRRWVVERSFGWLSRFRRLGRDLERLSSTLLGFHTVAFCLLLANKLFA
ncbi:IS5 family transposase [Deinococcus yavapaiensis]|uniref:IS4 family transposase n=1 Tax=Deinococcus yavapaiensis KR-236 TaxID=694435 RepID=A0A318SFK7_9DEIO|nr:IS5 family transposase [Deinococcus yavapaiensis]PYE55492.1 IS4 family transposase [Deinococcus yavapaiensis KR-236]